MANSAAASGAQAAASAISDKQRALDIAIGVAKALPPVKL